jgi:cell division protein FtsB
MDFRVSGRPRPRILLTPEDGLRALVERAPQAEAFGDRTLEKARPWLNWIYASRRRLATTAVGVLTVWLFCHVMFGDNGMVVYRLKRAEYQDLQKEVELLQRESDHYTSQINALKSDPKTIEKEAREQLHYARPGEVVYVAPAPVVAIPPPGTKSARK